MNLFFQSFQSKNFKQSKQLEVNTISQISEKPFFQTNKNSEVNETVWVLLKFITKQFVNSKECNSRKNILKELKQTQTIYLKQIDVIVGLQTKFRKLQALTESQLKYVFSSINQIRELSFQMKTIAETLYSNWHPTQLKIVPQILAIVSKFQVYQDYFITVPQREQIISILQSDYSDQTKKILRELKEANEKHFHSIESLVELFTIPTSRFSRYKLMFEKYKEKIHIISFKNLQGSQDSKVFSPHIQFYEIDKLINAFNIVYEKVNAAKQAAEHTALLGTVRQKFGNILKERIEWIGHAFAICQKSQKLSTVYAFTDRLVIMSNGVQQQTIESQMFLDSKSYIRVCKQRIIQPKLIVIVGGTQSVKCFKFFHSDKKDQFCEMTSRSISFQKAQELGRREQKSREIKNERNYSRRAIISVIGFQKRSSFNQTNEYIVLKMEEAISGSAQIIFIRVEEILNLENQILQSLGFDQNQTNEAFTHCNWQSIQLSIQENQDAQDQSGSIELSERLKNQKKQSNAIKIQIFLNSIFCTGFEQFIPFIFQKLKVAPQIKKNIFAEQNQNQKLSSEANKLSTQSQKLSNNRLTSYHIIRQFKPASWAKNEKRSAIGISKKIKVQVPHFKNLSQSSSNKFVVIDVCQSDTVGDVLQSIRVSFKLRHIADYGLALVALKQKNHQITFLLHEDEYIFDIIKDSRLEEYSQKKFKDSPQFSSFLNGLYNKFISSFSDNLNKQNENHHQFVIQLRKRYIFSISVESITCAKDPYRYALICSEIFYLFKIGVILLPIQKSIEFCALFVCIEHNKYLMQIKNYNIKKELIAEIMPLSLTNNLNESFLSQMWKFIENFKIKKLTQKLYFVNQLLSLVMNNQGFSSQFFRITCISSNFVAQSQDNNLMIGVNCSAIVVVRQNARNVNLIRIKLQDLQINYFGYLLYLFVEEKRHVFKCANIWMFKEVLDVYLKYNKIFQETDDD